MTVQQHELKPTATPEPAVTAAALGPLLTEAALGPWRRWTPGMAGARFAARLASQPRTTGRRVRDLGLELGRITAGTSEIAPSRRDRRFADPAWTGNPVLRRIVQAYLATGRTVEQLIDDAKLDWTSAHRVRFLADNLIEASAPSNSPLLNPTVWKAAIDSGGTNLARGAVNLVKDLSRRPRVPRMVDADAFEVGRDLAVSPGAVVLRTRLFELIQYQPQTPQVATVPVLIVPPMINKFYITDLAPGRSVVEHLVRSGRQVFLISWRNPDARHASWGLDTYAQAVLEALDAIERITRIDRTVLLGLCSGGILASLVTAHLAAIGRQDRIAGLALAVTVLDFARAGTAQALLDRGSAALATAASARRGYLDGGALAEVFAWLRPGDLVWNYWVNNYLLGRKPAAFDILYWNADTTRMPARLHADFVQLGLDNSLVTPGAATVLGTPVDLSAITVDTYVVAGVADHLCPWQNCYRSARLFGGTTRFVLSTSGHIAAIVNPPGNAKAGYRIGEADVADPEQWSKTATSEQGSWWADFTGWLAGRGGDDKPSPEHLGGAGLEPLAAAPGTYVFDR